MRFYFMVKYSGNNDAQPLFLVWFVPIYYILGLGMKRRPARKKGELKKRTPPGAAPGTMLADPGAARTQIDIITYGPSGFLEAKLTKVSEISAYRANHPIIWVNICGLGDIAALREVGEVFGLHTLSLEDSVNVYQRPKIELYGNYLYIVSRMADPEHRDATEQLSMFLGNNFVVTIQEKIGDCFDPLRERIRNAKGRIRETKSDFLGYSILDATIDFFFPLVESISSEVEAIEEQISHKADRSLVQELYRLRHDLLSIRRSIAPLRDAISLLHKEPNQLIQDETRPYLRDCLDHTNQLLDAVESNRDLISSLMEVYLSVASYKLNDVIRTLTVISIFFMPLNLIAGIYGMNFHTDKSPYNMPELSWVYGYPFAIALMATVCIGMFYFFHKKGWMRD